MTPLTLADFLRDRLGEDEAVARAATPEPWVDGHGYVHTAGLGAQVTDYGTADVDPDDDYRTREDRPQGSRDSAHITRWQPARVLAEVEAKQLMLSRALTLNEQADCLAPEDPQAVSFRGQALAWRVALRMLALPYADHPDYDESWRP